MKKEFDDLLCSKYPKIFAQRYGNAKHTAMCWGFECGDGWFKLIDDLCNNIQTYLDANPNVPQVEAVQVKEKFGTLRFYVDGGDENTSKMIMDAEGQTPCEECGEPGKLRNNDGWRRCLCDTHAIMRALTR